MKKRLNVNFFPYGTQYYRAPTPLPGEWARDLKEIARAGYTHVQFRPQWRVHERVFDRFVWDDLDRLMDLAQAVGLRAVVKPMAECAPDWVYTELHGERIGFSGIPIPPIAHGAFYEGGWLPCFDNPDVAEADVVVFNHWKQTNGFSFDANTAYVLRISKADLFDHKELVKEIVPKVAKLNVVITDVESFTDEDFAIYKNVLQYWANDIENLYADGKSPQLNLLTDRMMLDKMNNCGAADSNVTLAPDGKFYVCPAFYQANSDTIISKSYNIGSLVEGLDIKNPQLYKLDHAPICRKCDAYQCRRCIWLNRKTTLEVNTPSHEQCVVAHLERNASRDLLANIRKHGQFIPEREIKAIDYLDPFDMEDEY